MARPLHIAISARALSLPVGGVREYVSAMLRELVRLDRGHRFSIYYSDPRLLGTYPDAEEIYLPAAHKFVWDHLLLPRHLSRTRPDVVWFPHNVSSVGLSLPTVVSVMDMLYFPTPSFPQREYPRLDCAYMRAFIPRSLRLARRVVAISDWTASDIVRLLGIPRSKLRTIHLAVGSEFRILPAAERLAIRTKYRLERPFFFYAGRLSVRKNVRLLIEAFAQVHRDVRHDLVLTGGENTSDTPLDDLVTRHELDHRIHRLGNVPKTDLVALYNAADAFIFPSLYEGFGLPPLEAFACGCPVVSSNATSLSEVVGDAALTFDPHDAPALASHLRAVGSDRCLRERLARAGLERAKQFSYRRAADDLLAILEEVAA